MCGIFGCHCYGDDVSKFRARAVALSRRQRHRGPDWSGVVVTGPSILCHERLAIVGVDTGAQPLTSDDGTLTVAVNGEVYNHKELEASLKVKPKFKTHSDCEVIMYLYRERGPEAACAALDGMFAFMLEDSSVSPPRVVASRDPIGVTCLYYGHNSQRPGAIYFSSEMKSLIDECDTIKTFPPGHFYDSATNRIERYFKPPWLVDGGIPTAPANLSLIHDTLVAAVRKRLMGEVPYGVLLSGGLDSSLIAAIAARETERVAAAQQDLLARGPETPKTEQEEAILAAWPRLHSFSIGLENSPDVLAARVAAKHLNTVHHEYTFTLEDGLDAVADVIYHLETYDVTTVRASTPMYLLSRKIKAMGVKMVLSGEGSDEIFGGYLYFNAAPSPADFHRECISRIKYLHLADCLRANKSTMAWGLEARVPFLDKEFLQVVMNTSPADKEFNDDRLKKRDQDGRPFMEKYILRKAFDEAPHGRKPYLPDEILWRQKEQFSDGVGYSWIDGLKDHAAEVVSDEKLAAAHERYPRDTPTTKEAYYIREIFESYFPTETAAETVMRWVPREDWGCSADPSGRAVKIHDKAL